jgi:hypothetical protein
MSNMGYCRFRNTLGDLRDCEDHMGDEDLGEEEVAARRRMIETCADIAQDYGHLAGIECEVTKED